MYKISVCIALCAFLMPGTIKDTNQTLNAPYVSKEAAKMHVLDQEMRRQWEETDRLMRSDPRLYLQYAGQQRGLERWEIDRLDAVMSCESTYCTDPDNPVSSASGCFQIVHGTWTGYSDWPWDDRYDHVKNIDTALNIYQQSGIQHWSSCL